MLVTVVAFAALSVVLMWPRDDISIFFAARQSNQILAFFSLSLFVVYMLIVPGLTGTAIVLERERETYDLIHLSLISKTGIIVAKLASSIGYILLLLISTLPVLASIFFLIGVDWQGLILVEFEGL